MDTSSPTTSQTGTPSTIPFRFMKRNAFVMEEPSDSPPVSPSQKRARFIGAGESSGRPAPSISNLPSGDARLNADHAASQTPTRSTTATYSPSTSPDPFDGSQQSAASTAQDHNMAGGMASSLGSEDLTLELIVKVVNNLGNVPDYIRKLDMKRVAAEKSRDVQAKKVQDLEDEVERLKDRQNELELIIAGYKAKGKGNEL